MLYAIVWQCFGGEGLPSLTILPFFIYFCKDFTWWW